ncbi:MAG: aspartate--tRNA ligase [Candidatus Raymondbacteria bacterium RifOxyC12_full_50_8]|uniref:Aspartate--tRNA ligase n=1 Tax=Candidatus Raymondbacteria bacterium RIFOXYD12_FULL_49_13 TaxID=1817890 RepID=A0A1F7F0Q2_UNCRA|nr:MAG: aspartate--tRNA ligase [Candidatus Raymondbacteria bacterium RIFOXYA2_FULL_49_16]OGK00066.1 MAG: aspartate--tRNA ligase [Candidatus Raymondbacteria bacterium RIFOXYD12_FULL_49_13]OGK01355.1 MAG: aspartate--tRNA ligase [Candidatus Raymondbacteria bacterium RifOxyC12_full_50_8]OGK03683.1 MAG: aspartate--tRNA ligase [Candidatus Raymondbacteria bacterium RifOxyB12_full_50_8]OGP45055.1 MAG: aspartate--tRNA ligase [Candidatus Raymondbacteria bacterium RIFOXYB2_FULL_49_35]
METDSDLKRTQYCGDLRLEHEGKDVVLKGWVDRRRDLGKLIFIDLRDRTGKCQVVFNPEKDAELHKKAEKLRGEFVIAVVGKIVKRVQANATISTGEIEVVVSDLRILNEAETPPIAINEDGGESEEIRLKYRFLDLRRPAMQKNIMFRAAVMQETRQLLSKMGFIEIETPILMKSTPEGARDFLVPSRVNKGKFYALPQSPQTYKQLLMVSGFDKYFQIAKCFRDEDLRADRQPEFTQIDIEMSFPTPQVIYDTFGKFVADLFKHTIGVDVGKIPSMSYYDAMNIYGSDKPDTRFGMEMHTVSLLFAKTEFKVFRSVVESGGAIKAINAPACGDLTRKVVDQLTEVVVASGAKGLVWGKVNDQGLEGPSAKFFAPETISALVQNLNAKPGDMVFMVAADTTVANKALGALRLEIAKRKEMAKKDQFSLLWVTEFPLFEYSETDKRWSPMHHPFTAPLEEDISLLYSPEYYLARARAYDLVLNGNEIGGGSIRIHSAGLQSKVFELLGISEAEAQRKFGFLLNAFKYGAPPHGGLAFGLDRLVMIMLGLDSIRDVIPFPKTTTAQSLMDDCPSTVDAGQLKELGIRLE